MHRLNFEQIFEKGVTDNGVAEEWGGISCFETDKSWVRNRKCSGEQYFGRKYWLVTGQVFRKNQFDKQLLLSLTFSQGQGGEWVMRLDLGSINQTPLPSPYLLSLPLASLHSALFSPRPQALSLPCLGLVGNSRERQRKTIFYNLADTPGEG